MGWTFGQRYRTWGWLTLLYTGLTVVGVATLGKDAPRLLGALVLASGTLGWASLLTDRDFSGVLVPMGDLHVASAALFCLSWVVWEGCSLARPH
jgi:hypothetical protein